MSYLRFGAPRAVQSLAAGYANAQFVGGARKAAGSIVFSASPEEGDIFSVGDIIFIAGTDFGLGASLADALTSLAAALNSSEAGDVSKATYSVTGGNTLVITIDEVGPDGNLLTVETDSAVATVNAVSGGSDADKLDVFRNSVFPIVTTAGGNQELKLPNGVDGQRILLVLAAKGGASNAVVKGVFKGGTTLTFDAADELADLVWIGGRWLPIVNTGAVSA